MTPNDPLPLDYEAGDVAVHGEESLAHKLIMSAAAVIFVGALVITIALLVIPGTP